MNRYLYSAVAIVLGAMSSYAIPALQLDIGGGSYVGGADESTIANSDSFKLYALLIPDSDNPLAGTYRISAALYPKDGLGPDDSAVTGQLQLWGQHV
jgi:hypothetical protein